ncbi:MAG: hypothetical protein B7Y48_05440 [Methylophilales bacterium 28-44-11]|nr:MAG: hypothetical protein B7Y48_05440 [Methylophilales bacterium 28-44-11]
MDDLEKKESIISQCESEQIHVPESIQPFGFLLVVDENNFIIKHSVNTDVISDEPVASWVGLSIKILGDKFLSQLEHAQIELITINQMYTFFVAELLGREFTANIYRGDQNFVIELFPCISNAPKFHHHLKCIREKIQQIQFHPVFQERLARYTHVIKSLSGFHRVVLYKFDVDYHGEVIAESKDAHCSSYLGLHYPASDIPPQARALYKKNIVRVIPDVNYQACELTGSANIPVDMTYGLLRSISPKHIEYLKNMGVSATMVFSLIVKDRLWGLVACHHYTSVKVEHDIVEIFRWLSGIISKDIQETELNHHESQSNALKDYAKSLLVHLRKCDLSLPALIQSNALSTLLSLVNANGVAYVQQDQVVFSGITPTEAEILRIKTKLKPQLNGGSDVPEVFVTDTLPTLLGEDADGHAASAGLIALRIADRSENILMFFRTERVCDIPWAGNPNKAVSELDGKIHPRNSFELWKQIHRGHSSPWTKAEIDAANFFVTAVDIEFMKKSEDELKLLYNSISQLNDMVIITEAEPLSGNGPKIIFANQSICLHTGYTKEELIGKTPRIFQGPETSSITRTVIRNTMKEFNKGVSVEIVNYKKNGRKYWTELDISPVNNKDGLCTHWISVQRDITEKKVLGELLNYFNQQNIASDSTKFLDDLCKTVSKLLDTAYVLIGLTSPDVGYIDTMCVYGNSDKIDNFRYRLDGTPCENVVGKSFCIYPSAVQHLFPSDKMLEDMHIESYAAAPLWVNKQTPLGLIALMDTKHIIDEKFFESILTLLASKVENELVRKQAEEQIWHEANFDYLTDLPNRRMFRDRLDQEIKKAMRSKNLLALLFVDLDNFKEINDTLGHNIGDLLLKEVAFRLRKTLRESNTIARLGGDEFTVILSDILHLADVEKLSALILNNLSTPYLIETNQIYVTCSIGISIYPFDAEDSDNLIKAADQALYASKGSGKNAYTYFTADMQEKILLKMQLANDLRHAVQNQELRLFYQPIISLATGKIVKAEALLRWRHPKLGEVMPGQFIEIAEHTGLIHQLGDWAFKTAALQAKKIRELYDPHFQISVNKSPVQFRGKLKNHLDWFAYLDEIQLSGQGIALEITEGILMEAGDEVIQSLSALQQCGFELAIDDFGTGYSAMAYLKKYDIDYLKIDQAFVRNLKEGSDDMALCEAIIVMGHKLGIKIIAEGVETKEQMLLLKDAGADYGQGYLFSYPLDSQSFDALMVEKKVFL